MARPSDCADNVNWQYDGRQGRWDWPYHAHASLTLPVDAEELLFLAHGSLAHGSFEISHDGGVSEHATVNIDVAYRQESALNDATVCRLRQTHNTHGLGIFTSHWRHDPDHERQLRFHLHLRLPATSSGDLLELKKLRTDLPNFSQHLGELGQTTHFKTVELHASNGNLRADYLYANAAKLHSTNGGVHGVFNVSDILDIHTANGPIDVQANLLNEGERDTTKVSLETTNGAIHGNLGLFRPESTHTGGKYQANARSSNGPIVLAVLDAPANSLLNASVASTNAPVRVRAPAAYEGSFELRSAFWAPPEVERHEREDPLGRGRKREVSVRSIQRRAVRGEVAWVPGDDDAKSGHIWLETTNARAVLEL
ncbi:hypothetical protein BD413DRAFT_482727 [Trametes elegans]|nr:hypothetical protein BD413DRAFT_482727 [Trametes elegans]